MKQAYASLKGKWGIAIATLIIYVLIAIAAGAGPLLFVGIEHQWLSNITSLVIVPPTRCVGESGSLRWGCFN